MSILGAHAEPIAQLKATDYVNDFAHVLDQNTIAQMDEMTQQNAALVEQAAAAAESMQEQAAMLAEAVPLAVPIASLAAEARAVATGEPRAARHNGPPRLPAGLTVAQVREEQLQRAAGPPPAPAVPEIQEVPG